MTTRLGADGTSSSVVALRSVGATFICRYLSPPANTWKNLTAVEANALKSGGIDIVSNWEYSTTDWQGGNSNGRRYAQQAAAMHLACGGPADAPIYFSVDMDADPAAVVNSGYFQAINAVIGAPRTGAYAGTAVLRALKNAGLIHWTWRTMSTDFEGGAGAPGEFNIEQTGEYNSTYDRDVAYTSNFGQWGAGSSSLLPVAVNYQYNATHNFETPLKEDGQFGPLSWKALQMVLGVAMDGHPDADTISALQTMLVRYGSPAVALPVTGSLDTKTVVAFQEKVGVTKTGKLDSATSKAAQSRLNKGVLYGPN